MKTIYSVSILLSFLGAIHKFTPGIETLLKKQ